MSDSPAESMHRLFRHDPGLFARVAPLLGIAVPDITKATVLFSGTGNWGSLACRGNTLLQCETAGQESFLLLIEAQDRRDHRRPAHWAHHAAYLWAEYRLPTALLIVCPDQDTARWAAQPVASGPVQPPALTLHPFVAGPADLPLITDPEKIRADPTLTALSAVMHPSAQGIGSALDTLSTVLRDLPDIDANPLIALTAQGLHTHPTGIIWKHFVSAIILDREREKDRVERITKFRTEHLLLLLGERGLVLSEITRKEVADCQDPETLLRWLLRAVTASTTEEIFDEDG
ncbi:hypothetical protein ACFUIW_11855 [Streptomyces sp. NPDC057245]|uniref:hypothetical protein n=1 Tax=Streptomyces TaxID=1883 RepID=UPI001C1E1798|nr:hypothetical protein [Streptomyces sp. A108]MBU6535569.1 hypothetical protein [Streptomyces sp. A108]